MVELELSWNVALGQIHCYVLNSNACLVARNIIFLMFTPLTTAFSLTDSKFQFKSLIENFLSHHDVMKLLGKINGMVQYCGNCCIVFVVILHIWMKGHHKGSV